MRDTTPSKFTSVMVGCEISADISSVGFLSFEDAYGFYCGFVNSHPDEANIRDHLLHREHGLCVVICELLGQRYVLLQNEQIKVNEERPAGKIGIL